jgi:Domain of unknown function (DUF4267)
MGIFSLTLGLSALASPVWYAREYGLPRPEQHVNFVRAFGGRNVGIAISTLVFGLQGNASAAGTVLLCGVFGAVVDALVVGSMGKNDKVWTHCLGGMVLGGSGWWLLRNGNA